MKTKTILLTGIAIMAVGGAATTARADGFSFSISLGSPHHHHVRVAHRVPAFIPVPRVVVEAPRVVVAPPRVYAPSHCHPAPRVVVVRPPAHHRGHGHHGHPVHHWKHHGKHYKKGGLYYGDRGGSRGRGHR